ncbi:MAG: methyltransferase domain-containing protein [Micavibrio sp.]|nr:MAG: methyltransferase domain-containing protein [Micavibrio sp.]
MGENSKFRQLSFFLPSGVSEEAAAFYLDLFEDIAHSVFLRDAGGRQRIEMLFYDGTQPEAAEILKRLHNCGLTQMTEADFTIEDVPDKNWLMHVYDELPPFQIGRFFIYGHHYTGEIPRGCFPVQIHAAEAFGSGEHETTQGCLLAMQDLAEKERGIARILDMGCGSGVLALAAACLWPEAQITATDIDPAAVAAVENHAAINGFQYRISCGAGDGYDAPEAQKNAPYDLVLANLLSGLLIDMAPQLADALKPEGYAVLAGLLQRQKDTVLAAHKKYGLTLHTAYESGGWAILILKKDA